MSKLAQLAKDLEAQANSVRALDSADGSETLSTEDLDSAVDNVGAEISGLEAALEELTEPEEEEDDEDDESSEEDEDEDE